MLDRLSKLLTNTDYSYLCSELREYTLDEDAIYNWVYTLTPDKLKSRYITISILNQVREDGRYIITQSIQNKKGLYFFEFWNKQKLEQIPRSKSYIEHLISTIYEKGCPIEELRKTTDYITENYRPTNTDVYLATLKTSKLIKKYHIDLEIWEEQARYYYESYEEIMKDLESVYD